MKTRHYAFGLLLFVFCTSIAQDNCSQYYPMVEGTSFSYNMYGKKDKLDGTSVYTVKKVTNKGGETKASLNVSFQGSKKNESFEMDYDFTCTGDGIRIDFNSLLPNQMMEQYRDMDVEMDVTGTDIDLPNNLSVGQELADADVNVAMNISGMKMKIEAKTTNRKVVAEESVTTAAGTFDCVVLTADIFSKVAFANVNVSDKLWLAKGVGIVKQETYNKKGKLESRMELASFSK
ncbi:TapB family protein [Flagellimonas sp.]|uniref:TapB family protein n=1 Tax=Flagellimonas sp. TaxID=2058762 RepID=UPI003F4A131E